MFAGERTAKGRILQSLPKSFDYPSISATATHAAAIRKLRLLGSRTTSAPSASITRPFYPPTVTRSWSADWRDAPGRPTVLIYGHYDVQPAEPLDGVALAPFTPTVRGERLFRSRASDDKGQLFIHVKAIESLLKSRGRLPVNVVCLFEGEEEIGSPNLGAFLWQRRHLLAADFVVISDTQIPAADRPAITYSLRGALGVELEVRGPRRDLHSGVLGGAVGNTLQALAQILAGLHDARGRIAIPGFYQRVRRCDDQERAYMRQVGPSDAQILRDAGATPSGGERGLLPIRTKHHSARAGRNGRYRRVPGARREGR